MIQRNSAVLLILLAIGAVADAAGPVSEPLRLDRRLAGFDTGAFIAARAPVWVELREPIQHWAAYHELSPLSVLALLEAGRRQALWQSQDIGPAEIRTLARRLRVAATDLERIDRWALTTVRSIVPPGMDDRQARALRGGFSELVASYNDTLPRPAAIVSTEPPPLFLPIEYDRNWWFNGVHTWTGDDDGTAMSSIDLLRDRNHQWGDDTSQIWVAAAHSGTVSRFSECFVRITHASGWFTDYYHLENPQFDDGDEVRAGDQIANYADDLRTAVCQGGHSNLPHVHFALGRNGNRVNLTSQHLGEYRVKAGRFSYDSAPEHMWLERDQRRLIAWVDPVQHSALAEPIDYHFNGMWYQPELAGHGLNLVVMQNPEGTAITVFVVLFTYDDSGLANFYSGNIEVSEWRPGESLDIPLLQSANGGFSDMNAIDFDHPDDFAEAGSVRLTLDDCASGSADFVLTERTTGNEVSNSWALQKLLGVPLANCQQR